MSQSDDFRPELLILIEGELDPQRLIVTWAKACVDYGELLDGLDPAHLQADHDFAYEWGRVAHVDVDDVAKWAPVLFENGLLHANGTISDTAMGFVLSRGVELVPNR